MRAVVTVADCERVQGSWFRRRAEVLGGEAWTDGSLTWTDGPDGLNLMFPRAMTTAGCGAVLSVLVNGTSTSWGPG
jgi:hypothetical protein